MHIHSVKNMHGRKFLRAQTFAEFIFATFSQKSEIKFRKNEEIPLLLQKSNIFKENVQELDMIREIKYLQI